ISDELNYHNIIFSIKSTNIINTIEANNIFSSKYDYPLHLGITEAGPSFQGIIKSSVGIGSLFFHEFGHFIAAKASGVRVYKFAFGFGPRILGFTKNQTEYAICLIPLGGYVKMAGEMGQESVKETSDEVPEAQRFDKKSLGIRALIVALGPFMNIATAVVIFSLIFFINGIPTVTNSVSTVIENGPAEQAGIFSGDKIIAIDSIKMEDPNRIADIINKSSGEKLQITLDRGGEVIEVFVIPEYDDSYKKGLIGITFEISFEKFNIFSAFYKGLIATGNIIKLIFSNT
ncbi:unnamed protein product, partial [marine sediment metagenome]